ncbi:MAG: polymerase [Verrucomicrobiota bacterium]|jgi:nucleotidyltransferase/DNA polymerase involved in DNA repair
MFATIYLPNFYFQASLRHQPDLREKPVALLDDRQPKSVIMQLNEAAEQAGVHTGMTASQGLARSLNLVLKTRCASQEKQIEEIVLHFAFTLAPYVEATGPGLCTIQFTTRKNLSRNVRRVTEVLAELELSAQAGIAETPDTSLLAAYLAKPVLEIKDTKDFLASLPIETLAIPGRN